MNEASGYPPARVQATSRQLDTVGAALSGACVVHCVSAPLVVTLAPAAGAVVGGFHPVLLVAVIVVALAAFVPGFLRHRSVWPLSVGAVGIGALAVALAFDDGMLEAAISVMGACAMMAAHWLNRLKLQRLTAHVPAGA